MRVEEANGKEGAPGVAGVGGLGRCGKWEAWRWGQEEALTSVGIWN